MMQCYSCKTHHIPKDFEHPAAEKPCCKAPQWGPTCHNLDGDWNMTMEQHICVFDTVQKGMCCLCSPPLIIDSEEKIVVSHKSAPAWDKIARHGRDGYQIHHHHGVETFLLRSGHPSNEARHESIQWISHRYCNTAVGALEKLHNYDLDKVTAQVGSIYGQMKLSLIEPARIGMTWLAGGDIGAEKIHPGVLRFLNDSGKQHYLSHAEDVDDTLGWLVGHPPELNMFMDLMPTSLRQDFNQVLEHALDCVEEVTQGQQSRSAIVKEVLQALQGQQSQSSNVKKVVQGQQSRSSVVEEVLQDHQSQSSNAEKVAQGQQSRSSVVEDVLQNHQSQPSHVEEV